MKSDARTRFHSIFDKVKPGERFYLVNSIMEAVMPNAFMLEKIDGVCSMRLDTNQKVIVRPSAKVEIVRAA